MDLAHASAAAVAAFLAGAINSIAGGGTLISFPTLVWIGLPSVIANATNTVATWPGSVGGAWGFRRELRAGESHFLILIAPSLAGGIIGALLLRWTPPTIFDKLAPALVLFATLLFMAQKPLQRLLKTRSGRLRSRNWLAGALLFQFLVALYGGYFGAGIGILILAALGILGFKDILKMNGLKNLLVVCINGVAAFYFMWARMVDWPYAILMAAAAISGGYAGSGLARRAGAKAVRRVVITIGFAMTASLLIKLAWTSRA
ncbi:MAG TPA: sulfite exporter TauE/SafE family protein [Bryobacteraceae bacterium]|nr:sulfite exporter TauE/SafE family protein [Bryobacteraceae bacterium]